MPNRRKILIGIGGTITLAGCAGNESEQEPEEESVENYVNLVDHYFERPSGGSGVDFYHTIENISEQELDRVTVECELFVDNERIESGRNNINDLGAGIQETDRAIMANATRLEEITHYTLSVIARVEREDIEETYEYDEFEYQW